MARLRIPQRYAILCILTGVLRKRRAQCFPKISFLVTNALTTVLRQSVKFVLNSNQQRQSDRGSVLCVCARISVTRPRLRTGRPGRRPCCECEGDSSTVESSTAKPGETGPPQGSRICFQIYPAATAWAPTIPERRTNPRQ